MKNTGQKIFTAAIISLLFWTMSCDEMASDATLEITSPKNGDSWTIGEPNGAQIAWENDGVIGELILALIDDDDSLITIISDNTAANAAYFYWTVPDSIFPANKYHILITSEQNPEITSLSGAVRIEAGNDVVEQTLDIVSPSNNDEWQAGKRNGAQIRWEYGVASGYAFLALCKDGEVCNVISDSVSIADGLHVWSVPDSAERRSDYTVYIQFLEDSTVFDYSRRFKVVDLDTSQYVEVLEPDGQTTWMVNDPEGALIRWDANQIEGTVRIDLYKQSELIESIAAAVDAENGLYTWTVPSSVEASNGYQVYVESNEHSTISNLSARFRIDPYETDKELEVTTPSGGDRWEAGVTNGALTEWTSSGLTGTVHLDLYQDGFFFMSMGTDVDVTEGYFTWTVAYYMEGGSGFEVYIGSDEDSLVYAYSSSFRINPSENPSVIEVVSPSSGDKWMVLEEDGAVIEWESENLYDSLHIELFHEGAFVRTIAERVRVLDYSYTWTVPLDIPADRGYQIYIESDLLPLVNDLSAEFTIKPTENSPSLEVATPSKWEVGDSLGAVIEWESENLYDSLHIELFHEGAFVRTIAEGVRVLDYSYTWTVPLDIPADRGYQIYIESDLLPLVNDLSAEFTIKPTENSLSLEVDTPSKWEVGDSLGAVIEWEHENLTGTIMIQLFQDEYFILEIADSVNVDSLMYEWTVPNTVGAGKYQVYIESNVYPLINSLSREFRITEP